MKAKTLNKLIFSIEKIHKKKGVPFLRIGNNFLGNVNIANSIIFRYKYLKMKQ